MRRTGARQVLQLDFGVDQAQIAHGFGQEKAADIVKERCTRLET